MAMAPQRDGTVQFSLDDIRALSAVSAPSSAPPPPLRVGYAGGDDSGLIDMRSLAQAAAAEQDSYRAIGSDLQTSPLDTMRPFALPVRAERGGVDFRTKVLAGVASFGFLLAGGIGVLALTRAPQPQAAVVPSAGETPARASAAAVTNAPAPAMAAIVGAGAAADPKPAAVEAEREPATEPEEPAVKVRRRGPRPLTRSEAPAPERAAAKESRGTDIDDILAKSPPKSEPAAAKAEKAEKPSASKGGDDIDALLLGALDGKKSAPKPAAEPAQDTVAKIPSRDEVRAALGKAKAKTAKCKGPGVAMADITIANTGRVSNVSVSGVEGAAKSCVETAVRSTPFPKFQQPSFAVKFPFKLN
jgi:hypothetical protein